MAIPVAKVRGPEKNFGTNDRSTGDSFAGRSDSFLIEFDVENTVAPSVEELHPIPPGINFRKVKETYSVNAHFGVKSLLQTANYFLVAFSCLRAFQTILSFCIMKAK
ncbi:hypothetical protein EHS15_00750 [Leptospira idonii]|uniref:Uncharacterized protein n=2 Tax=Leptospira idonii TaxID=1193500 RepID=A0A4R9M2S3_9LEPT|nr:hypothetical protein EHS15_00750 [Leptospira idonii]